MRERCFLKRKSGAETRTEARTAPWPSPGRYLAVSEQRREVEEEGLAERDRLNRVVEVFALVELYLENKTKQDGLVNGNTPSLSSWTSSGQLISRGKGRGSTDV